MLNISKIYPPFEAKSATSEKISNFLQKKIGIKDKIIKMYKPEIKDKNIKTDIDDFSGFILIKRENGKNLLEIKMKENIEEINNNLKKEKLEIDKEQVEFITTKKLLYLLSLEEENKKLKQKLADNQNKFKKEEIIHKKESTRGNNNLAEKLLKNNTIKDEKKPTIETTLDNKEKSLKKSRTNKELIGPRRERNKKPYKDLVKNFRQISTLKETFSKCKEELKKPLNQTMEENKLENISGRDKKHNDEKISANKRTEGLGSFSKLINFEVKGRSNTQERIDYPNHNLTEVDQKATNYSSIEKQKSTKHLNDNKNEQNKDNKDSKKKDQNGFKKLKSVYFGMRSFGVGKIKKEKEAKRSRSMTRAMKRIQQ